MKRPVEFSRELLEWQPWVEPLAAENLTRKQKLALVDKAREKSNYFTLLARDPDILEARTRLDKDIFHNATDGLPRADRELAAAATSRFNGCIYCASVHARLAGQFSKNFTLIDKLLSGGTTTHLNARWDAIVAAATALSQTPPKLTTSHLDALQQAGLNENDMSDLIQAVSFFNWANRLMLSLGEPFLP